MLDWILLGTAIVAGAVVLTMLYKGFLTLDKLKAMVNSKTADERLKKYLNIMVRKYSNNRIKLSAIENNKELVDLMEIEATDGISSDIRDGSLVKFTITEMDRVRMMGFSTVEELNEFREFLANDKPLLGPIKD